MFATSSVELTTVVLFVFTFDGSATPCSAHVAVAPAANPLPYTWTSRVFPLSPLFGSVLVTVRPVAAVFPNAASSSGRSGGVARSEQPTNSTAAAAAARWLRDQRDRGREIGIEASARWEGKGAPEFWGRRDDDLLHGQPTRVLRGSRRFPREHVRGPVARRRETDVLRIVQQRALGRRERIDRGARAHRVVE